MRVDVGAANERAAGTAGAFVTREAFAHWVHELQPWEWFATLTFDEKRIEQRGVAGWDRAGWSYGDRASRLWLGARGRRAQWMRFREANERGGWHFHALVSGVGNASRRAAWSEWFDEHGLCRVLPVERGRDAAFYVSKYVTKDEGELAWRVLHQPKETALPLLRGQEFSSLATL